MQALPVPPLRTATRTALLSLAALAPALTSAQFVTPKTIPVHQSDQFDIFPSQRMGMAGVDLIYEPMTSETWADAARDTAVAGGGVVRAGGRTVENAFRFSNVKFRLGVGRDRPAAGDSGTGWGYQLGLGVHAIDYRLRQRNHVERSSRVQDERWMEWSPTFALRYQAREFALSYNFRLTCGTGGCISLPIGQGDNVTVGVPSAGGIIAAPSAPSPSRAAAP